MDPKIVSTTRTQYAVRKGDLWLNPSNCFKGISERRLWNRPQDAKSALTRVFPNFFQDPFKLALEWSDVAIVEIRAEEKTLEEYPVSFCHEKRNRFKPVHSYPKKGKKEKK